MPPQAIPAQRWVRIIPAALQLHNYTPLPAATAAPRAAAAE